MSSSKKEDKVKLGNLIRRMLLNSIDPKTGIEEFILIGYSPSRVISTHLSRYLLASKFIGGIVLDVASGTCYGSSILRRKSSLVISVDINKDALLYGKKVYHADCVLADALHLPFRESSFNCVVSMETIEHLKDAYTFLYDIKNIIKRKGILILSTPNKLIYSPCSSKPINLYHKKEYYLGQLLKILENSNFKVSAVWGGRKTKKIGLLYRFLICLLRRILSPFIISKLEIKVNKYMQRKAGDMIDPDPNIVKHMRLDSRTLSNMVPYEYFIILCNTS
jgi:2-polyprenyl-3-methyl-5-hydroxy-6-metoxy-1,4-benzoquinol methylase